MIEPKGAGFEVKRADEGREFLTSSDQWFRPVNLAVGPEGALYVVDMYREIIEDYSAIPRYLQQQYLESLRNGQKHGRIWRITYGEPTPAAKANMAAANNDQLIAELAGSNAWRRLTAQRLLIMRADREVTPALEQIARAGKTPQARLHALYTLEGLVSLTPGLVKQALDDDHHALRIHALRLAEPWLDREPSLLSEVLTKVDDPHPKVRLQLAFTLGESKSPKVLPALARLVETDGQDRWMQIAVLSAVPDRSAALAGVLAERGNQRGRLLLRPLAAVAGTRRDGDEIARLLQSLADLSSEKSAAVRESVMTGLIEGLARDPSRKTLSAAGQKALERLLSATTGSDQRQVLRLAGLVRLDDSPIIRAMRQAAFQAALDQQHPLAERTCRAGFAFRRTGDGARPSSGTSRRSTTDRAPIRGSFAPRDRRWPRVPRVAFQGMVVVFPSCPNGYLRCCLRRKDRLALVLDAIENKVIESSSIPPIRREQLLDDRDPAIRQRAKSLFSPRATNEERNRVLARYQTALSLPRDANRGRQVFEAQCSKCHQLNGKGFAVAPDLAAINNRPDESLLLDILDPNSTIVAGFRAYTVDTVGGRVYSGVLTSETATSVTLRREQGAEDTILRKDIDAMFGSSLSLMPEGIEKLISPQDMANLIGYLRAALRGDDGRRVLLFGGDPSFALVLNEGNGRAVVDSKESFAGSPSLRVSPPQRFSPRITGWDYKIVENPGPGEYRYLRFAWKAPGATGLMLELANDGAWPSAGEDRQRFYSGTNTTGWNAVRVSEQVPRDWVIVTRDLWKEFGMMRLTGLAPTAMNGDAFFARIELLPSLDAEANK